MLKDYIHKSLTWIMVSIFYQPIYSTSFRQYQNPVAKNVDPDSQNVDRVEDIDPEVKSDESKTEEKENPSCPAHAQALFKEVEMETGKTAPTCSKSDKNVMGALLLHVVLCVSFLFCNYGHSF